MLICKRVFGYVVFCATLFFQPVQADVLYGFTNFPHDLTMESAAQVHAITIPNSTLYAQHMDQCVPWHEVLAGEQFPAWLKSDLNEIRQFRQPHQTMYVAVTPTQSDRQSLAEACGQTEGETRSLPSQLYSKPLDAPEVKAAYVAYVRRIIDELNPTYINIGIEMSELALRRPQDWPAFDNLFRHTVDALDQSHPQVKVGLELVLQSILKQQVGDMVKPTAEYGDYIGISFYPYGSEFGELFGAPSLNAPPTQWQAPLEFLADWTDRPIAIAETGYVSDNITINEAGGLNFRGSDSLQTQFLDDLIRIAIRDNYLFVVWFVAVDYSRLLDKMADAERAAEWMKIWVIAGLFDANLNPKPAFASWAKWRNQATPAPSVRIAGPELQCATPGSQVAPSNDTPAAGVGAAVWTVTYGKDWELCSVAISGLGEARGLMFQTRSTPEEFLLVQIEESDGDLFFAIVKSAAHWQDRAIQWREFAQAPGASGNGKLNPDRITAITFGDGGGADGATGLRRIYLTQPSPLP